MAPDDIAALFSSFGPVTVRRMFGGAGIFADGTMFALIHDGAIYLKAGAGNGAMFERENLAPFTYRRRAGEMAVMSYRRMPDRLYDDPEELAVWARAALAEASVPKRVGRRAKTSAGKSTAKARAKPRAKGRGKR
jgi:DNA transformation protein and related proteins